MVAKLRTSRDERDATSLLAHSRTCLIVENELIQAELLAKREETPPAPVTYVGSLASMTADIKRYGLVVGETSSGPDFEPQKTRPSQYQEPSGFRRVDPNTPHPIVIPPVPTALSAPAASASSAGGAMPPPTSLAATSSAGVPYMPGSSDSDSASQAPVYPPDSQTATDEDMFQSVGSPTESQPAFPPPCLPTMFGPPLAISPTPKTPYVGGSPVAAAAAASPTIRLGLPLVNALAATDIGSAMGSESGRKQLQGSFVSSPRQLVQQSAPEPLAELSNTAPGAYTGAYSASPPPLRGVVVGVVGRDARPQSPSPLMHGVIVPPVPPAVGSPVNVGLMPSLKSSTSETPNMYAMPDESREQLSRTAFVSTRLQTAGSMSASTAFELGRTAPGTPAPKPPLLQQRLSTTDSPFKSYEWHSQSPPAEDFSSGIVIQKQPLMANELNEALRLLDAGNLPQAYAVLKRALHENESVLVLLLIRELRLFHPSAYTMAGDPSVEVILRRARMAPLGAQQAAAAFLDPIIQATCAEDAKAHMSPWSLVLAGVWLMYIKEVPQKEKAASLFNLSSSVGNAAATYNIACCYQLGSGVQRDMLCATRLLKKAAEQSHASAQGSYAQCLERGEGGIQKNIPESVRVCRLAVAQGLPSAQAMLGNWLLHGEMGLQKDEDGGFVLLRSSAEQGNAAAQHTVGQCYHRAEGVGRDNIEAARYWKLAADQGYAPSQLSLSTCYERGEGVQKDQTEAVRLCRAAAAQGYAQALCTLAIYYKRGEVVPKDTQESARLFKQASDQGYALAQFNLGLCFERGEGVVKSLAEALRLYALAANQGFAPAQCALGLCYERGEAVQRNPVEAVKYLRMSADQGHAPAQYSLALCMQRGEAGLRKDPYEIARLLRLAADQGHPAAQCNLALCYHRGEGVPKDIGEALRLTRMAAERGHTTAIFNLALCYKRGDGVRRDLQEAARLMRIAADQGNEVARDQLAKMFN
eukprot:m51a1_g12720 hypothetical protein (981) ;mRNA; r:463-3467